MSEGTNIPNNSEIDQALKEFEAKTTEQKQKELEALKTPIPTPSPTPAPSIPQKEEPGIKFETDNWKQSIPSLEDNTPKMVQLVMKWSGGAIKDQKQAEYVLLGLVIVMLIVSFYLFFGVGFGNSSSETPGLETFQNAPRAINP